MRTIRPRNHRGAFTLVELLVVIAIIGILVSMTLPAVQAAREVARRSSCLNNVVQLSLAVHGYEFANERLPTGVANDSGPILNVPVGRHVSWTAEVLPFLDEAVVYQHFDFEAGAYSAKNAAVAALELPVLQCPSDPAPFLSSDGRFARTSYVGCHHDDEAAIDAENNGLLFLNSEVRRIDILDGANRTLLLAEALTDPEGLGWLSGTRATLRNTGRLKTGPREPSAGEEPAADFVGGFSSLHPGVVVCGFADGACRTLHESIDPEVLRQLGARADGELPKPF